MSEAPSPTATAGVGAANELTARWVEVVSGSGDDVVLSGVGVWVLLALLAAGAGGRARDELEWVVGSRGEDALAEARRVLHLLDGSPSVRAALGVWAKAALDPEWAAGLPPGTLGRLTGDVGADQAALDAWVREETGGEFEHLPIRLTPDMRVVLATAVTVRTRWRQRFRAQPVVVGGGPWAGETLTHLTATAPDVSTLAVAGDGLEAVTVLTVTSEAGSEVDVVLFLGPADAPAGAVLSRGLRSAAEARPVTELDDPAAAPGVEVATVTSPTPGDRLVVMTPAFDVRASHDLLLDPETFGLATAMDAPGVHFPGLSPEALAVGAAAQHALARFSEEGFVASAVTAISMVSSARPAPAEPYEVTEYRLTIDRPFGFAAVHRPTSLVLAAGWVAHPPTPPPPEDGDTALGG